MNNYNLIYLLIYFFFFKFKTVIRYLEIERILLKRFDKYLINIRLLL